MFFLSIDNGIDTIVIVMIIAHLKLELSVKYSTASAQTGAID